MKSGKGSLSWLIYNRYVPNVHPHIECILNAARSRIWDIDSPFLLFCFLTEYVNKIVRGEDLRRRDSLFCLRFTYSEVNIRNRDKHILSAYNF